MKGVNLVNSGQDADQAIPKDRVITRMQKLTNAAFSIRAQPFSWGLCLCMRKAYSIFSSLAFPKWGI